MDPELKELLSQLIGRFDKMETRMDSLEQTVAQTNSRLDALEENTTQMNNRLSTLEQTVTRIDLRLENEIGPTVQLLLENQAANHTKLDKLPPMEEKLDDVHSRVQVIEDVVTDHSQTIKAFKPAK